jgi:ubiquinone/menaquinone biosynthesis C-methylase UbiE
VFEFGCGTGAFATKLMTIVPADCRYVGIDVSPKMTRLATARLKRWADRATVKLSDGSPALPEADGAFDRFVANYVFELLSPDYAAAVLAEAHRILSPNGKLCLVSLGCGTSGPAGFVTTLWKAVWKWKPALVGGCRPSELRALLAPDKWSIDPLSKVVSFGVTSEVVVASRRLE